MGTRFGRSARNGSAGPVATIPLVHRLAASPAFQQLFRDGMGLVESAAAYLDGPGREESRGLPRPAALAYATESMRLTTRLMQIASWLLLRRAVNEGELTPMQALSERHRVKLARQALSCAPELLAELPQTFQALNLRSLRLQERILHLDQSLAAARAPLAPARNSEVQIQRERISAAFGRRNDAAQAHAHSMLL
jgi:regulator of CtrA degradation